VCACTHYLVFKEPTSGLSRTLDPPLALVQIPNRDQPRLGELWKVT